MAYSPRDSDGPIAAINVTPLVDVMLVLLVIFMITAPMLQQGVEVNLPKATTAPIEGNSEQIVISVDREGQVFLGAGNKLELETFTDMIKAVMETRPPEEQKVYIKADTQLEYGRIMDVMAKLHDAGIHQIGLVSAPLGAAEKAQRSASK